MQNFVSDTDALAFRHQHYHILFGMGYEESMVNGTNGKQATIFENSIGLSSFLSRLLAACNGTEYFLASFIAIFTIEKFGRRKLMIFGAAGQAVSFLKGPKRVFLRNV